MAKKEYGMNMKLFTSYLRDKDTFKMMPVTADCPFLEVIYDPSTTLLIILSKTGKETFQFVPKLDDDGNQIAAKKPKMNGKPYREQRVLMHTQEEYYITTIQEQRDFIHEFAVNANEFDYAKYLRDVDAETQAVMEVEKQPLVDEKGVPLIAAK